MRDKYWPLVGFDTETTGVSTVEDRIVTAAMVVRDGQGVTQATAWLLNPGVEIPWEAQAVHGITTQTAVERGMDAAEGLEDIADALAKALAGGLPLLAFNAPFDLRILDSELTRYGLASMRERLGRDVGPVIDPLVVDRGADRYRKGPRKLADLVAHYGLDEPDQLHDAVADVETAMAVFDSMLRWYPSVGYMSPAELHAWQAVKHREWADNHNAWLATNGRLADVDPTWP